MTFAPAADLAAIIEASQGTVFGTLMVVSAAVSWSEARDELDLHDAVAPGSIGTARDIAENTPTGDLGAPLLAFQGEADPIILPEITRRYVAARCHTGDTVDLRIVPRVGHFTLSRRTADDAVAWARGRFEGAAASSTC